MKPRSDYEGSHADKFYRWLHGEYDPFAGKLELREEQPENPPVTDEQGINREAMLRMVDDWAHNREIRAFRVLYKIASVFMCIAMMVVLLITVANLPPFGAATNPAHNEVMVRYLEKGIDETGAVNAVTGMILNYRAFDTFGETCVLFIASCCVMILLMAEEGHSSDGRLETRFEPKDDPILYRIALFLGPIVFLFGIYIILNGHLSPGGGFSGGAMIGAGLILFCNALGLEQTRRFFNEHIYKVVKVGSLVLYGITMSYYFFTGGNGLQNIIPLGTPGHLISSGMILPINIFVGLEVACTMYSFFSLFRQGSL